VLSSSRTFTSSKIKLGGKRVKNLGLTLGAPGMTLATDFLQEINSSIKL